MTNTNWQFYGGETTISYLSQMAGLTVQNFVSAAVGMAVLVAVIRGIRSRAGKSLGNFWQDITRTLLYILLPLAIVGALILVSQGVIQTLTGYQDVSTVTGDSQTLAMGPAASQIAIKQLGTNGGGFFNVNSAFPFENPTAFSGFVELLFILMIPAGLVFTYGRMVGSRRQGWALYGGDGGADGRRDGHRHRRRAARLARPGEGRARAGRRRRDHGRQHGGQGGPQRDRQQRRSGRAGPPTPPTARSTPPTTRTRGSAAPCRWRT